MNLVKKASPSALLSRISQDQAIYDNLNAEERAEVDRFNAQTRACGGNIDKILALGDHPMKRFRARAAGDRR